MSDVQIAEDFVRDYGDGYRNFLARIKTQCELAWKQLGMGVIDSIYTRKDSTGGGDELKEPSKIAGKVRQKGQLVSIDNFLQLNDIVGITVVVQYPDQIDTVINKIEECLKNILVKIDERENHQRKNGYFATHLVCNGREGIEVLRCEIQLKTLLHDAWSAKLHDLTYKPLGMLDPRLAALMASIADTIDSVENQSQLIRGMIKAGWNVEEKARTAARQNFLRVVPARLEESPKSSMLKELQQKIEGAGDLLNSEPHLTDLVESVRQVCADPDTLRYGWVMAGRIASLKPTPDLVRFFGRHATAWLDAAPNLLTSGKISDREISGVPMMYYCTGDLDRAIDSASGLLDNSRFQSCLTKERLARINFNRVTFMVEREYHFPTSNKSVREALKEEIEEAVGHPSIQGIAAIHSALVDTMGLMKITFGDSTEQVREGIEDCVSARSTAPADEREIAGAYVDLNLRLGWRRYFVIEARDAAS